MFKEISSIEKLSDPERAVRLLEEQSVPATAFKNGYKMPFLEIETDFVNGVVLLL